MAFKQKKVLQPPFHCRMSQFSTCKFRCFFLGKIHKFGKILEFHLNSQYKTDLCRIRISNDKGKTVRKCATETLIYDFQEAGFPDTAER